MTQPLDVPTPESFSPNHEIKACSQQHANLISESVCNDSVSVYHGVGHAATQSAVLYVCVLLCSHYINQSPKHLPNHRSSCRRDLGIYNTCLKIQNSESCAEERIRGADHCFGLCPDRDLFEGFVFLIALHRC